MKLLPLLRLSLACLLCTAGTALAARTILQADFDAEPLDEPIATGGPSLGQPVSVSGTITAFVHAWPYTTPSLKINDADLLDPGFVRFQFIDSDTVVAIGTVVISAQLWFTNFEEYGIRVRERRISNSKRFLDLVFGSTGIVRYRDQDTTTLVDIGTYSTSRPLSLVMTFDLDAATYSVELDGTTLLTDEPGATPPYQGIGAILIGLEADDDPHGELSVDDLVVTADSPTSVGVTSWAGTKALYR